MTIIYSVGSLKFTKEYSTNGGTLAVKATQDNGMNIEHCFSVRKYMGTRLEYLEDESLIYLVIELKHVELRYVFSKPVDIVREYSNEIVELMGF